MNRWKRHVLGIFFASALVVVLSLTVSAAEVKVSGAEEAKALLTVITGDDTWHTIRKIKLLGWILSRD